MIDADQAIGCIIQRRREVAGLSASALGRALGLTYQQVRKYETGQNRVSTGALLRIAEALGCTAVEIVAEVEHALRPAIAIEISEAQDRANDLVRQIAALPADSRRSVEMIVGKLTPAINVVAERVS
ncbi:helix-turn-helix domain-containing protein [Antarcticirhabdus aurantiaca]|uniref:Helix-turn-helix transcriptional regulator n=1 Tax=Antarcticirhabdus aurantiaca TaxID=2606717 RepID=A0ACD4NXU2_9HYPH|nr:helix-turn-helix transcriptional regulator [Jeongeuplla avenae]